jgi:hypothetical protein
MSSSTLESTIVAGRRRAERSLATEQAQQFIGTHGGRCSTSNTPYKSLAATCASLNARDTQRVTIVDDVEFITFVQSMSLSQVRGNRDLALAIQTHFVSYHVIPVLHDTPIE